MTRWRRWALIGLGVVGIGVGLTGIAATIGWAWLRTDAGNAWLQDQASGALASTGGSVGSIETDLWTYVRIEELDLKTPTMVLHVGRLDADLDRSALFSGGVHLPAARADGVLVDLTASAEPSGEPFSGLGVDLWIDALELSAANVRYRNAEGEEVVRVVGLSGTASLDARGDAIRVDGLDVAGLIGLKGATAARITGGVTVDAAGTHLREIDATLPRSSLGVSGDVADALDLRIDARRLGVTDLDTLLGGVGIAGDLEGTATVTGPTSLLGWTADLRGVEATRGAVKGSGSVDLGGARIGWTAELALDGLQARDLYPGLTDEVRLTGNARLDGRGTSWPDDLVLDLSWSGGEQDLFGQHLDGLRATVRIADGKVAVKQVDLRGIVGDLVVTGDVGVVDGPLSLQVDGTIEPSRLRALGVTGIDAPGVLSATVRGDLRDPDAPIRVAGTLRYAPFRSGDAVRFDRAVVTFDALQRGKVVDGTASVIAEGGLAGSVAVATAAVDGIAFHVAPDGTTATGTLALGAISVPDQLRIDGAEGTFAFDGAVAVDLALDAYSVLDFPGERGAVRVRVDGDDVAFDVGLISGARPMLDTAGHYDLRTAAVELDRLALAPTPRATWTASAPVRLRVVDGGVDAAELRLASNLGAVAIRGRLGTTGVLDGAVRIEGLELDLVSELFPASVEGLAGSLDLDATITGPARDAQVQGTVRLRRLWLDGVTRWLDVAGEFGSVSGGIDARLDVGVAGAPLARIGGSVPVRLDLQAPRVDPDGRIDLTIAMIPGTLERIARAAPSVGALPSGRMGGALSLRGPVVDPDFKIAGVAEVAVEGWPDPVRAELEWERVDGAVRGWADLREGYTAMAQTSGVARTHFDAVLRPALVDGAVPEDLDWTTLADDLFVTGAMLGLPVDRIAESMGLEEMALRGALQGGFQISGNPATPQLDGSVTWIDGRLGKQRIDGLDLVWTPTERGYAVDLEIGFRGEGPLAVRGEVPAAVDLRTDSATWFAEPMDLVVEGGIPVRAITALDRSLTRADGSIRVGGHIRGTPTAPKPSLSFDLEKGAITVPELGLRFEEITFGAKADTDHLELARFTASPSPDRTRALPKGVARDLGGAVAAIADGKQSRILGSARVELVDGALGDVEAEVRLIDGAWVMNTSLAELRLDGDLKITGAWPALDVGGKLKLAEGRLSVDSAAFVDKAPLQPDPRIRIARRGASEREDSGPPWYASAVANVSVDLQRNLTLDVGMPFVDDLGSLGAMVSRADLFARVGGGTTLTLEDGVPRLTGEVDVLEGRLRMFNSRLQVEEGTITFTGADATNPRLDLSATMDLPTAQVVVDVSGTATEPEIAPRAEGYDDTDVLLMLMTGRAPDEMGSASGAAGAVAGLLASGLIGQSLGDFSFEPDGSVRYGAALNRRVYLTGTYRSRPELGENPFTGEADVNLGRRLVWNVGAGEVYGWTDLYWELRF